MKRRALIIYCDNTHSGSIPGTIVDELQYRNFLTSNLGGEWYDKEIISLRNPDSKTVRTVIKNFLSIADYSFIVFAGHGYINTSLAVPTQFIELADIDISILDLKTKAKQQTIIIDACRNRRAVSRLRLNTRSKRISENLIGDPYSTRKLFEKELRKCGTGISILYAAEPGQFAIDSNVGGAFSYSLIRSCLLWEQKKGNFNVFNLREAITYTQLLIKKLFLTDQNPCMQANRSGSQYFPLAVKINKLK